MKILMTTDCVGGVWTYTLGLCRGLLERDPAMRITLVTMGAPLQPHQRAEVASLSGVELIETSLKLEWQPDPWDDLQRAGQLLRRLAREQSFDSIHLNQFAFGAIEFGVPKVVVGHSCVTTWWRAVHDQDPPAEWNRYRDTVNDGIEGAASFVSVTNAMKDAFERSYPAAKQHVDHRVIHNGVYRDSTQHSIYQKVKERAVLAAGRAWDEAKNLRLLNRAAATLDAPVWLAGEGGDFEHMDSLGHLPTDKMRDRQRRAGIYCLPARYEPFGLSILEAAHAGCALVLGDIPTLRELWQDAALFVDPDDAATLRDYLHRLLHHTEEREELAEAAHQRAQCYAVDPMVDSYLRLYNEIIQTPAVRGAAA